MPADGTHPSIVWKVSSVFWNAACKLSCFVTSVWTYSVLLPNVDVQDSNSFWSTGPFWMSQMATLPPISQMAREMVKPMPWAPPVTI